MAGVAQVWLTHAELEALLHAGSSTHSKVSEQLWSSVEPKLRSALEGVACEVPRPIPPPQRIPVPQHRLPHHIKPWQIPDERFPRATS